MFLDVLDYTSIYGFLSVTLSLFINRSKMKPGESYHTVGSILGTSDDVTPYTFGIVQCMLGTSLKALYLVEV